MRDIALMGRAGAGKDTAAAELVERSGYARVAFADPLKRMALAVDPIIAAEADVTDIINYEVYTERLSEVVARLGWDRAKMDYPEVRRFLQRLGLEGVRDVIGADTWLRLARYEIARAWDAGRPVVVTDVRFRNELDALRAAGFVAVWIDRPGVASGEHASEAELDAQDADAVVVNDGDRWDLWKRLTWARDGIAYRDV